MLDNFLSLCASSSILVSPTPTTFQIAPVSLHPCPFPSSTWSNLMTHKKSFNLLTQSIANPVGYAGFLRPAIVEAAQADPFTGRLLKIADDVFQERYSSPPHPPLHSYTPSIPPPPVLGILRHDYMLHTDKTCKQVEVNTIASSFGCLSTSVTSVHHAAYLSDPGCSVAPNKALHQVSSGVCEAVRSSGGGVCVMVVQEGEKNSIDQNMIIVECAKRGVKVVRMSMDVIGEQIGEVKMGEDAKVEVEGKMERVGLFYFRAGYQPQDYKTENDWNTRLLMERSSASKCPDVFYHLAGAKKVQQMLAPPGVVEGLCGLKGVDELFAGLYGLGHEGDEDVIQMALDNPMDYVLKPQREGGGNNLYKDRMVAKLKEMTREERKGYILMELIKPPKFQNQLIRNGEVVHDGTCTLEVGVFGVSLYTADGVDEMEGVEGMGEDAYICRAKAEGVEEGGVAAGFAFLSSVQLV
ncbi:hypothetical protein TrCOL_g4360 [Triparma columacea]|uniref:Glutathione synthetase n=2 Tax=Triparma columacea TaxID=722753 RepID=A0A9W7GFL6_9STRA|nr:hypothetical protein TrCOL_g4360 [Triparma columacea]